MHRTDEILSNIVWLIDSFDEEALEAVQDIPFVEMAKTVKITPPPVASNFPSRPRYKKYVPSWRSTIKKG
jgi:hypothetical protein